MFEDSDLPSDAEPEQVEPAGCLICGAKPVVMLRGSLYCNYHALNEAHNIVSGSPELPESADLHKMAPTPFRDVNIATEQIVMPYGASSIPTGTGDTKPTERRYHVHIHGLRWRDVEWLVREGIVEL